MLWWTGARWPKKKSAAERAPLLGDEKATLFMAPCAASLITAHSSTLAAWMALLHVSDIAWSRVNKPADVLSVGQQIEAKVLKSIRRSSASLWA